MPATMPEWAPAYLASGSTAIGLALRIVRKDGGVFAFTTIRRRATLPAFTVDDLTIPETTYTNKGALRVSNIVFTDDPGATDNWEATITPGEWLPVSDVERQLFSGAEYVLLAFDWRTSEVIRIVCTGFVGMPEVENEVVFKMRGLSHILQAEILEVTSPLSRAKWGDPEYNFFDLDGDTADGYAARVTADIDSVNTDYPRQRFTVDATADFPDQRFINGIVSFVTGDNAGFESGIQNWDSATGTFDLDRQTPNAIAAGDTIMVQVGEPRTIEQWRTYFGNARYFAGEPRIPTIDQVNNVRPAS